MEATPTLISVQNKRTKHARLCMNKVVLKKHLKEFKNIMAQNTEEYCENTTLHGLKYLTKKDLYIVEKLFFALAFVAVVGASAFFIQKVYDKWNRTPVIFSIDPEPNYITDEPFPALTICNLNQAYKSKAEQYSIYSTEYAMIQMLCKRDVNVTIADTITDWSNLKNFIIDISQPCSNILLTCRFGAVDYNCSEIFHPIVTDGGLCCTFNMVHHSFLYKSSPSLDLNVTNSNGVTPVKWSAEDGYPAVLPKHYTPRTGVGTGETLGLTITLDVEADQYYCSASNSIGFKILLHNPTEVPNMREIGLLLSPGRETKVRIRAEKTASDQSLRSIHRRYRQCLFQDEENLDIFIFYTQRNCEIECMARKLLAICGCISHYMPQLFKNESICSIYDATCVERVRLNSMRDMDGTSCPDICWASCFDVTYLPDFFSSPLSHSGFQITNQVIKNISSAYAERNLAVLNIYFKENAYRSNKQAEFIGMTDFLSSIGGLIGLFVGFSFISIAEFVYYGIMRPCRVVYQIENHEKHRNRRLKGKHMLKPHDILIHQRYKDPFGHFAEGTLHTGVFSKKLSNEKLPQSSTEIFGKISQHDNFQRKSELHEDDQWFTRYGYLP